MLPSVLFPLLFGDPMTNPSFETPPFSLFFPCDSQRVTSRYHKNRKQNNWSKSLSWIMPTKACGLGVYPTLGRSWWVEFVSFLQYKVS